MPYADKDLSKWSEDQYNIFALIEVLLGNYEEKSEEDIQADIDFEEGAELMLAGEDWESRLADYKGMDGFEDLNDEFLWSDEEINKYMEDKEYEDFMKKLA